MMDPTDYMVNEWFQKCRGEALYSRDTWQTNEGEQILLKDLTNNHLKNIIAMIKRTKPTFVNSFDADAWLEKLEEEYTKRLL